ncbi:hypothetical protein NDU88_002971 [Pleurodeles waltl]|uniref:Uncharacterized protein n=1 Tax=Pleurodeles waltl TaxID=8319 RepID=A0AAV7RFB0_PLEWA|nr:hypothetical protein NDU88_002971 [Pleurodeles waltl]
MNHQSPGQQLPSSLGWPLLPFATNGPPPGPPRLVTSPGAGAVPLPAPRWSLFSTPGLVSPSLSPGAPPEHPLAVPVSQGLSRRLQRSKKVLPSTFNGPRPADCPAISVLSAVLYGSGGSLIPSSSPVGTVLQSKGGPESPPPTGPRPGPRSPDPLHGGASAGLLSRSSGTAPVPSPPGSLQSLSSLPDPEGPEAKTGSFHCCVPRAALGVPRPLEPPAHIQGLRARQSHLATPVQLAPWPGSQPARATVSPVWVRMGLLCRWLRDGALFIG